MDAREIVERLKDPYPDVQVARGEATLVVDRSELLGTLEHVSEEDDLAFRFLSDLSATDWPGRDPRFWIAYHLYSIEHGHRLRVKVGLPDGDPSVPTVTALYPTANWQEREVFDMFGVAFEGHPDLRRILMPDDWEGHPLRKDYGLGGVGTQYKGAFIPPVDQRSQ